MRLSAVVLVFLAAVTVAAAPPENAVQVQASEIVWKDGPAALPKGTKMAVLEGDMAKEGIFTVRLRFPAGTHIAPHWHPRDERVTVLSGRARVGFGDTWDDKQMRSFNAGDFYVNPAESHHFVDFPMATTIQITGEGPWELHPLSK